MERGENRWKDDMGDFLGFDGWRLWKWTWKWKWQWEKAIIYEGVLWSKFTPDL